jgi:preprotein translocase SecE subunit
VARDRKRAKQRQQQRRGAARSTAGRTAEREERAAERPGSAPLGSDGNGNGHGRLDDGASHLTRADLPGSLDHVGDVDEFDAAVVRGAEGVPLAPDSISPEERIEEEEEREEKERAPVRARPGQRAPAERRQALPARAVAFLRASWAELQRVQWPNRAQVTQATAVVLGFVAIAGVYFGVADYVAKEIVEAIL